VIALDHLVVMARSLDEGARWLEQELGVRPDPGGAQDPTHLEQQVVRPGPAGSARPGVSPSPALRGDGRTLGAGER
jgi:hypothetical protein